MVLKKKKDIQVAALIVGHQELETLRSFADAEGENLASLLLRCVQLTDGLIQIHCIKEIVPLLEKIDRNQACDPMFQSCLDILGRIYFSVDPKNPLKKVLASSLNGLPEPFFADAVRSFTCCLREELKTTNLSSYRKVIDNLASCMENFNLGRTSVMNLFKDVLQFLQKVLVEIPEENRKFTGNHIAQTELMHDLLITIRVSVMLVQKVQEISEGGLWKIPSSPIWQSMCDLLSIFSKFLRNDDLLQNIQSTSGLAVILLIKTMCDTTEMIPGLVNHLILHSVGSSRVPEWFWSTCRGLCTEDVPGPTLLFLCQGAVAMLNWKDGSMGQRGEKLLMDIASVLFTLSLQLKESSLEMFLSRILVIWTNSALDMLESSSLSLKSGLNGNSDTVGRLLEYVYTHWEHPLDAVRHQTKIIFRNLLQIHQRSMEGSACTSDPFFLGLTESLLRLEWHVKGKYTCLSCLVDCVGTENILVVNKTIPSQILEVMGDQSLAPYASDLLETMFKNHKNRLKSQSLGSPWIDQWHETWVSPLLLILREGSLEQTAYIIDYYLPKLLKCSPESLGYMVKILQTSTNVNTGSCNSRGSLGALMACLRTARAHGHLQSASHVTWASLVSSAKIKQGLVHQHCQVRIDALGLLCESHRSTEIVSVEEMQLVQFFILYNLNSQSPGMRQQICSLLKKLFSRIQESSQVLYKLEQSKSQQESVNDSAKKNPAETLQQYQDFMSSICNSLFGALFPGSSHSTKFSALTILGSIAELFPVPEGKAPAVFQLSHEIDFTRVETIMECFSSTFEEVKILAFDLLMKLPKTIVHFQDSLKLQALFRAAMDLSTSTKPYDCVTASYLLRFLIGQEGLPAALATFFNNPPGPLPCQRDGEEPVALVERNTLMVIRHLLENLEREISQAESSLLQAAALFPMYGRVHCIIGAFQQLPLNVVLVSEWRHVVAKLILTSYRLSAVVAPVVQSSSPEGLIPMDTDSETASRLQMILNEIQPRDTNDYFNQVKMTKNHNGLHFEDLTAGVPMITTSAKMKGKEGQSCDVTAQAVLVCCWRSMKEVALLLGMLCQLVPLKSMPEAPGGLVTVEQVKNIGDYFKQHLLQSRHRGAFELAYTGFVKLTQVLSRCPNECLQSLPEQWLRDVLEEIKSSNPSSKLCATRRSAGIPFYIQALLASEPKKGRMDLLKITMKELISLAVPSGDSQSSVPQVHALNILRALFRDTRLGENIIPYVADGIQAAILGFLSPVWAVRNSSTLLFSSLITRIFGVKRGKDEHSKKNRMTGREFFSRFPALYPFLLKQLEVVANTVDSDSSELKLHPNLFLLLLILGRLYPSPMDGTSSALSMAPFVPFIRRCGHSAVYRSREMAAQALVPFVMIDQIPNTIRSLLSELPDCTDLCIRQNHVHGMLLQVSHLLQSYSDSKHRANSDFQQELTDITVCIKAKLWLAKRQNPCLVTRAACIDILILLTRCLDKAPKGSQPGLKILGFWEEVGTIISESELKTGILCSSAIPGLIQYLQSLTRLVIAAMFASAADPSEKTKETPISLVQLLHSNFPEVRLLTLETVLHLVTPTVPEQKRGEERGPLPSLPDVGETLLKMAMEEKHQDCFGKVLKILHCMDVSKWLPLTESCIHRTPKEFLTWTMNVANVSSERITIQSQALRLASGLVTHHVQVDKEGLPSIEKELNQWVQLVAYCCGGELQTETRLAAAEVLISITPVFLTNQHLILGLPDTLTLWKCVFILLQSEEQAVRDKAAEVVQVALSQENTCRTTEFAFCLVDASMALDLAVALLCELLQQWDQLSEGLPTLLQWLLGEDDTTNCIEDTSQVEDDFVFDKGEVNFWAETLTYISHLVKHLSPLCKKSWPSQDPQELSQLRKTASQQFQHLAQLSKELPPTPEFSKTTDYMRLCIQKERTLACLKMLDFLEGKVENPSPGLLRLPNLLSFNSTENKA
ncbi:thyroid adenoma-associated protein isoform X2 [Dromiciops gliroides]|uniref:thyroid adenoma-associated protein isoform X2 n=1 Tax=Dromiciops gliroides TaxID=33562 RepID=UPI001CC721C0|nr:thyroid adenoma-associated protein isoform X2 [Dromiciops gliroides]